MHEGKKAIIWVHISSEESIYLLTIMHPLFEYVERLQCRWSLISMFIRAYQAKARCLDLSEFYSNANGK